MFLGKIRRIHKVFKVVKVGWVRLVEEGLENVTGESPKETKKGTGGVN